MHQLRHMTFKHMTKSPGLMEAIARCRKIISYLAIKPDRQVSKLGLVGVVKIYCTCNRHSIAHMTRFGTHMTDLWHFELTPNTLFSMSDRE